jgi:hypothetical protein
MDSSRSVGLGVELVSATWEPPNPELWFGGLKDIALWTGCKSNEFTNLDAVFFARRSVPTAM